MVGEWIEAFFYARTCYGDTTSSFVMSENEAFSMMSFRSTTACQQTMKVRNYYYDSKLILHASCHKLKEVTFCS